MTIFFNYDSFKNFCPKCSNLLFDLRMGWIDFFLVCFLKMVIRNFESYLRTA